MSTEDRRAPGAARIPFDSMVEVGGALGPAFEAQAVNLSEEGMQLRTAYLPEAGQPLTCRFDAGGGQSVLASGEVVWAQGGDKGGEFGVRFTELDPESVDALKRLVGAGGVGAAPPSRGSVQPGSKVRLHIDGLASPMRAKIKDAHGREVTVGSDLGFLQVGRQLDLEDAQSGSKRPAAIDRVDVIVDPASNIPQLVVTLRYADAQADADAGLEGAPPARAEGAAPRASRAPDAAAAVEDASLKMKGAVSRNMARLGGAFERLAQRAKITAGLLALRHKAAEDAPRRTTAPAPGGGLHASGRRVVRGEADGRASAADAQTTAPKLKMTKRKAAVASGVMVAAVLGALALKKAHPAPEPAAADTPSASAAAEATAAPAAPTAPSLSSPPPIDPAAAFATPPSMGPDDGLEPSAHGLHHRHAHVTPFGNGPVHHGNVLHLKMDGPIESIEGAQQPTGFAVKLPGRKALEAAGPLAARDARIAAIKVSNDQAGAELTVTFRDGVPNYQVGARGDTLVIALAPAGALEKVADKDDKGGKSAKHGKHENDRDRERQHENEKKKPERGPASR
jgi:hypothetical protein